MLHVTPSRFYENGGLEAGCAFVIGKNVKFSLLSPSDGANVCPWIDN
jgi:hypothetical protein